MSDRLTKLQAFLDETPDDSFLIFAVAKEYEKMDDLERAAKHYDKIILNDPKYVGVYYHRAKLYESLSDPQNAIKTYKAGLEIAKKAHDFHAASELNSALMNLEIDIED